MHVSQFRQKCAGDLRLAQGSEILAPMDRDERYLIGQLEIFLAQPAFAQIANRLYYAKCQLINLQSQK